MYFEVRPSSDFFKQIDEWLVQVSNIFFKLDTQEAMTIQHMNNSSKLAESTRQTKDSFCTSPLYYVIEIIFCKAFFLF